MGKAVAKKPATKKGGKCGGKDVTKGCKYGVKGFKGAEKSESGQSADF